MKHPLVTSRYVWRCSVSETQDYNASKVVWCHRMSHYDDAAPADDDYFNIIIIIPIRYLFMLQQSDVLHKRQQSEGHAFSLLRFRVICVRIANVTGEKQSRVQEPICHCEWGTDTCTVDCLSVKMMSTNNNKVYATCASSRRSSTIAAGSNLSKQVWQSGIYPPRLRDSVQQKPCHWAANGKRAMKENKMEHNVQCDHNSLKSNQRTSNGPKWSTILTAIRRKN